MSHVEFKKSPCRPVELRGLGPYIWVEREEVCERLEDREGADPGGARRPQPLTAPKPLQYLCIIWKLVEVM